MFKTLIMRKLPPLLFVSILLFTLSKVHAQKRHEGTNLNSFLRNDWRVDTIQQATLELNKKGLSPNEIRQLGKLNSLNHLAIWTYFDKDISEDSVRIMIEETLEAIPNPSQTRSLHLEMHNKNIVLPSVLNKFNQLERLVLIADGEVKMECSVETIFPTRHLGLFLPKEHRLKFIRHSKIKGIQSLSIDPIQLKDLPQLANLRRLDITKHSHSIIGVKIKTDVKLLNLVRKKCPNLEHIELNLSTTDNLSISFSMKAWLGNIKSINIPFISRDKGEQSLNNITQFWSSLREIQSATLPASFLLLEGTFPTSLEQLTLYNLTPQDAKFLKKIPNLKSLSLYKYKDAISIDDYLNLEQLKNLEELVLHRFSIKASTLAQFPKLKKLEIMNRLAQEEFVELSSENTALRYLELDARIKNINTIARYSDLETLNLHGSFLEQAPKPKLLDQLIKLKTYQHENLNKTVNINHVFDFSIAGYTSIDINNDLHCISLAKAPQNIDLSFSDSIIHMDLDLLLRLTNIDTISIETGDDFGEHQKLFEAINRLNKPTRIYWKTTTKTFIDFRILTTMKQLYALELDVDGNAGLIPLDNEVKTNNYLGLEQLQNLQTIILNTSSSTDQNTIEKLLEKLKKLPDLKQIFVKKSPFSKVLTTKEEFQDLLNKYKLNVDFRYKELGH